MLYQKKNEKLYNGFQVSFFRNFNLFPEFLWFLVLQSRITDVAGFEFRDRRKYIRKRNEIKKNANARKRNEQSLIS